MNLSQLYVRDALANAHYPTDSIRCLIKSSNTDGVAFYGQIPTELAVALADRLLRGLERALAKRAVKRGYTLSIQKRSTVPFDSYRSMVCVESQDPDALPLSDEEQTALDLLRFAIDDDCVSLSKALEKECYRILDSGRAEVSIDREFKTREYLVKITEEASSEIDTETWSEIERSRFLEALATGKEKLSAVKVEIFHHSKLAAKFVLTGVTQVKNEQWRSIVRFAVKQACKEARAQIWGPLFSVRAA